MKAQRYLAFLLFLASYQALAHAEGEGHAGFLVGLLHPALGFDHLLAMLSVGILSAQIGGRALWSVPLTFVSVMTIGAILGGLGVELPLVESGIALSVTVLGIALAAEKNMAIVWAMLFVGFFAIFHGHAHGTEMPDVGDPLLYGLGFILGTAFIHLSGVLIGVGSKRIPKGPALLRISGAAIAVIGLTMLFGTGG
jgi:urease accessory protein